MVAGCVPVAVLEGEDEHEHEKEAGRREKVPDVVVVENSNKTGFVQASRIFIMIFMNTSRGEVYVVSFFFLICNFHGRSETESL